VSCQPIHLLQTICRKPDARFLRANCCVCDSHARLCRDGNGDRAPRMSWASPLRTGHVLASSGSEHNVRPLERNVQRSRTSECIRRPSFQLPAAVQLGSGGTLLDGPGLRSRAGAGSLGCVGCFRPLLRIACAVNLQSSPELSIGSNSAGDPKIGPLRRPRGKLFSWPLLRRAARWENTAELDVHPLRAGSCGFAHNLSLRL
jgi:hypothetical protein